MKMKFRNLIAVAAVLAIPAFFAGTARADSTLDFSVWAGAAYFASSCPANSTCTNFSTPFTIPTSTAGITGTITDPSNRINFYSNTDNNLSGFLMTGWGNVANGNHVPTYLTGSNQNGAPMNGGLGCIVRGQTCGINNDVMEFTGTTYLQHGATYSVTHDDGAYLFFDGSNTNVLGSSSGYATSASGPTSPSTFMWGGISGPNTFSLWYSEVNGPDAALRSDIALTPEPPSLLLLGTGLLGLAFLVFRRKAVKPVSHPVLSA